MQRILVFIFAMLLVAIAGPFIADALLETRPDTSVLQPPGRPVAIGEGRTLNVHDLQSDQGGPPIVLVHGSPGSTMDWSRLPELLNARGHRVIVYDRAGYGYSTRQEASYGNYTVDSNARDLLALLDALYIEEAALVGWSFGGGVVQNVALRAPERVQSLTLIASIGPRESVADPRPGLLDLLLASPLGSGIVSWLTAIPPLGFRVTQDRLVEAFSGEQTIPSGWTIQTLAMLSLPGTARAMTSEARNVEWGETDASQIDVPTLVIHGSEDRLVSYTVGEDLDRRIPRSHLLGLVGGSHMLPVTHAEPIADAISQLAGTRYRVGLLPGEAPPVRPSMPIEMDGAAGPSEPTRPPAATMPTGP